MFWTELKTYSTHEKCYSVCFQCTVLFESKKTAGFLVYLRKYQSVMSGSEWYESP
jgi:hypothetical protein